MKASNNRGRMSKDWVAEKGARYKGSEVCCPMQSAFPPLNKRQQAHLSKMQQNVKSLQDRQKS